MADIKAEEISAESPSFLKKVAAGVKTLFSADAGGVNLADGDNRVAPITPVVEEDLTRAAKYTPQPLNDPTEPAVDAQPSGPGWERINVDTSVAPELKESGSSNRSRTAKEPLDPSLARNEQAALDASKAAVEDVAVFDEAEARRKQETDLVVGEIRANRLINENGMAAETHNKLQRDMNDINSRKEALYREQPRDYWDSLDDSSKVWASVGVALSTFAAVRSGTENVGLKILANAERSFKDKEALRFQRAEKLLNSQALDAKQRFEIETQLLKEKSARDLSIEEGMRNTMMAASLTDKNGQVLGGSRAAAQAAYDKAQLDSKYAERQTDIAKTMAATVTEEQTIKSFIQVESQGQEKPMTEAQAKQRMKAYADERFAEKISVLNDEELRALSQTMRSEGVQAILEEARVRSGGTENLSGTVGGDAVAGVPGMGAKVEASVTGSRGTAYSADSTQLAKAERLASGRDALQQLFDKYPRAHEAYVAGESVFSSRRLVMSGTAFNPNEERQAARQYGLSPDITLTRDYVEKTILPYIREAAVESYKASGARVKK